jgi:hypothetical protein
LAVELPQRPIDTKSQLGDGDARSFSETN